MQINTPRLLDTARRLMSVYSPTGEAGGALDALAELLESEGFVVERPAGGYPQAPAVVARLDSGKPGKSLQFNGHLDTVHLPFVPPNVVEGRLTGTGASDMKGGTAAAVEALLSLRDAEALTGGTVLLTAHDLHEAPWGDGRQLDTLIREGIVGDAVLLPEPLSALLPVIGRGQAYWSVTFSRSGPPVHEVMRPMDEPDVIAAGAAFVRKLKDLDRSLESKTDPLAGRSSAFIGKFQAGEIYNGFPHDALLEGTRRWLPGGAVKEIEAEFRGLLEEVCRETGANAECTLRLVRDAFQLDESHAFVKIFLDKYQAISGKPLSRGQKPFVDDGNSFWSIANVPAITHGPRAGGQHTVKEWADVDDLARVARLYAETAISFCDVQRNAS